MTTSIPISAARSSAGSILPPLSRRASSDLFDIKRDFGTLKSSRKIDSDTAARDEPVYYKFNLEKRSKIRLSLENQRNFNPFTDLFKQPNVVAAVLNDRGRSLQTFDKVSPDKTEQFTSNRLDEGTYYLKISLTGSRRSVDYTLQVRRGSSGLLGTGLFG
ncbi:hypothetical protein IFO70_03405 [Phormidium tenue FACHB-886]|nr:hypothetical protein [Phormidium tenue FACHB-886]